MRRGVFLGILLLALLGARVSEASEQSERFTALGLVEFHADKFPEALDHFERAVAADPDDVFARYYRGVTRGRRGDFAGAADDLRIVVAKRPDLVQANLELGVALVESGHYEEALPWLTRARWWDPEADAQASMFLGLAQLRLGRREEARENFQRAAAKDPSLAQPARYYEGVIDYEEGNWWGAQQRFTAVANAMPGTAMGGEAGAFLAKIHQSERPTYEAYGALAFQYDSNVVIAPSNDVIKESFGVTRQSDGDVAINLGGTYAPWRTDHLELRLGYDFYQSLYFDLTQFDLQDHGPSVQLSGDVGRVHYGLLGRYDYYLLESTSFLQQLTAFPWVTILDGEIGRTEVYYRMRRRDFKETAFWPSDGFNHAVGARQFFYLDSADRYLWVGYQFDSQVQVVSGKLDPDRITFAKGLGYNGNEANAGVGWLFPRDVSAEVSYAYRHEQYAEESAQTDFIPSGDRRVDREHLVTAALRKELSDSLAVTAAFLADINNSNDPRFEYDRYVGSLGLELRY